MGYISFLKDKTYNFVSCKRKNVLRGFKRFNQKKAKDGVWSFPSKKPKKVFRQKKPKMVYGVFRQKTKKGFLPKKFSILNTLKS